MKLYPFLRLVIPLPLCLMVYLRRHDGCNLENYLVHSPYNHHKDKLGYTNYTQSLRAIVTGFEHSGTTLLGSLLYNAPCAIGAFETGYLLASEPRDIENVQPWFKWNSAATNTRDINYRLSDDDIHAMKKSPDFSTMYAILRERSYLFNDLIDEEYCQKPYQMVDKTPRYVYKPYFERILRNTPGVPVIVTQKNYEALKESWDKRNDLMTRQMYDETFENVWKMKQLFPGRIMIVHEDELMNYPSAVMHDVFTHVGFVWKDEYLQMEGLLKKVANDTELAKRIELWKFQKGKHSWDIADKKNGTRPQGIVIV